MWPIWGHFRVSSLSMGESQALDFLEYPWTMSFKLFFVSRGCIALNACTPCCLTHYVPEMKVELPWIWQIAALTRQHL